jgi:hypothetical protein
MKKHIFTINEIQIVKDIINHFSNNKCVWDNRDEETKTLKDIQYLIIEDWIVFKFNNPTNEIIINYNDKKLPKEHLKYLTTILRGLSENMTSSEFKKIPFYSKLNLTGMFDIGCTNESFGLLKRKTLALEIANTFKKLGINKIKNYNAYSESIIESTPTLYIWTTSSYMKSDPIKNTKVNYYETDFDYDTKNIPIKHIIGKKEVIIGNYLPNRNIIILGLNFLFNLDHIFFTEEFDLKDNPILLELMQFITKILSPLKIKKKNISQELENITIRQFQESLKSREKNIENEIIEIKDKIQRYESLLREKYQTLTESTSELNILSLCIKNTFDYLKKEIKSLKKLSIINKVTIDKGYIKVEYIPTCIIVPNFEPSNTTTSFGKRKIYIGRMVAKLYPNKIEWDNLDSFKIEDRTYKHPHISSRYDTPCYGSGEASILINKLLGEGKYTELIRYLWIWIQTCRDGSGYTHSEVYYNYNLRRGFPIWDEKGERILINDPSRIESGEQEKLVPLKEMEKNLKLFENF